MQTSVHNVIAQGVSVMTVQASGARLLRRLGPRRVRAEAILAVEETGREALTETRRLLGILRRDSTEPQLSPQPGVASLQALIDREHARGLPVSLTIEGEARPLPASVAVTAYRVVEDALASVREHASVSRGCGHDPLRTAGARTGDRGRRLEPPRRAGRRSCSRCRSASGCTEARSRRPHSPDRTFRVNVTIPLEARE